MPRCWPRRGFPAERVKASKFSSTPEIRNVRREAKSYRIENVVKITTQDEKEFRRRLIWWMPRQSSGMTALSSSIPTKTY